jgi:hypothetical protein
MTACIPFDACPLCASREMADVGTADCSAHPLYKRPPQVIARRR